VKALSTAKKKKKKKKKTAKQIKPTPLYACKMEYYLIVKNELMSRIRKSIDTKLVTACSPEWGEAPTG
jgi:hypothetical protein